MKTGIISILLLTVLILGTFASCSAQSRSPSTTASATLQTTSAQAQTPTATEGPSTPEGYDPADPFTEEQYAAYTLPVKIDEFPSDEQFNADVEAGAAYLWLWAYRTEADATHYRFDSLPPIDTQSFGENPGIYFRDCVYLAIENPGNRQNIGGQYSIPMYDPAVYGLFEKEILPLTYEKTDVRPYDFYVFLVTTDKTGVRTIYYVYADGSVIKQTSDGERYLAATKTSPEVSAYFITLSLYYGRFYIYERNPVFFGDGDGARICVQKDGERILLGDEQTAALRAALTGGGNPTWTVTHGANDATNKTELFRFCFVCPAVPAASTETGYQAPDENLDKWYRFYTDGTYAYAQNGYSLIDMSLVYGLDVKVVWESEGANVEEAMEAIGQ